MKPTSADQSPVVREQQYDLFVSLLARNDASIRRFVRSLLPSSEGVDDVVQETALECWKKFDSFVDSSAQQTPEDFVRWACVIARFKSLSWQRDRSRERLVFRESVIDALADAAAESLDRHEDQRRAVEQCLQKLPETQRRLVLSVYTPGQSIAEIARDTGQKARRLYSTLNSLRSLLQDCVETTLAKGAHDG